MLVAALLLSLYVYLPLEEARSEAAAAGQDPSHRAVLAPQNEPGEKLEMRGVVLDADGRPLAGAVILAYHTDTRGLYNNGGNGRPGSRNPRLRGTLRTNSEGRFEFRSIKPGTYPGGNVPAHIHFEVTPPTGKTQYFEVVFRGEPYVAEEMIAESARGSAQRVVTLERGADGILRASVELRLRRT
jgi:protocatechuate 3,4-dioxygenase beta subunit